MRLEELLSTLQNSDRLRIFMDESEVYEGYLSEMEHRTNSKDLFEKTKNKTVKSFRCIPEIRHKKWKELNLMYPLNPDETPDFEFSDLQLKLYYTVFISS